MLYCSYCELTDDLALYGANTSSAMTKHINRKHSHVVIEKSIPFAGNMDFFSLRGPPAYQIPIGLEASREGTPSKSESREAKCWERYHNSKKAY